jgi:hypothetical protein
MVVETLPDEICWYYRFHDLHVEGNEIVVTTKSQGPLCRLDLSTYALTRGPLAVVPDALRNV